MGVQILPGAGKKKRRRLQKVTLYCDEVGDAVASALCHTCKTNDLHFYIANKDDEALSVLRAILDLMR